MAERAWGHGLVADLSGLPGEQSLYRTGVSALLSLGSFSLSLEDKTCEIWELWMQRSPGTASSAESCVLLGATGCWGARQCRAVWCEESTPE